MSVILVCRFHLELQKRNAHPNINTLQSIALTSVGSFHAAARSMHNAVMAEFGDSISERVIPDIPELTIGDNIELEEPSRSRDAGGPGGE